MMADKHYFVSNEYNRESKAKRLFGVHLTLNEFDTSMNKMICLRFLRWMIHHMESRRTVQSSFFANWRKREKVYKTYFVRFLNVRKTSYKSIPYLMEVLVLV